jgi:hypothetical protein
MSRRSHKQLLVLVSDAALAARLVTIAAQLKVPVSRLARHLIEVGLRSVKDSKGLLFTTASTQIPTELLQDLK